MRVILFILLQLCSLSLFALQPTNDKSLFVDFIFQFKFTEAKEVAVKLDEGAGQPYYEFLSRLFFNSGQNPGEDSRINRIVSTPGSNRELLRVLIKGVYHLYNTPSNEQTFGLLAEAIVLAKRSGENDLLKIAYLAMLELYAQEIVQTSNAHKEYLDQFLKLASNDYEMAFYHIYNIKFISKRNAIDDDENDYFKPFREFENYLLSHDINQRLMTYYYFQKGVISRYQGQYAEARKAYAKAVEASQQFPFLKYLKFTSLIHLCHIESLSGDYDKAKTFLDQAENYWNISDSMRSRYIQELYSAVYYYEPLGLYDSAYHLLSSSMDQERFMDFRNNTLRISELNIRLGTTEKENEILVQQNQLVVQRRWIWTIAIFLTIFAGLIVGLTLAYQKIQSKNRKIHTLMRELHHRVKNNLQVISSLLGLQSMKLEDEAARKAVSEGKGRIRAMSLIHQNLYQYENVTSLDIQDYIKNLVDELARSYGFDEKAQLTLDIPSIVMDADTSLPLGLIINEVVSNAFKYAYQDIEQPILELRLTEENKNYNLLIRDNGKGLPHEFNFDNATSFGMKLVNLLIKQLKGSLNISSEGGLAYNIQFRLST